MEVAARSSPARWAGSSTRSFRERPGCCSTILGTWSNSAQDVCALLADPAERERLGANGRQRTVEQFLGDRHLEQWAEVFARLDGSRP